LLAGKNYAGSWHRDEVAVKEGLALKQELVVKQCGCSRMTKRIVKLCEQNILNIVYLRVSKHPEKHFQDKFYLLLANGRSAIIWSWKTLLITRLGIGTTLLCCSSSAAFDNVASVDSIILVLSYNVLACESSFVDDILPSCSSESAEAVL
jgi:hypothetical protein